HGQQGHPEEALAAYAEVVRRFGDRPEAAIAEQVAKALVNAGITHGQQGHPEEALAAYAEVVRRFGDRPEAAIAEQVATALVARMVVLEDVSLTGQVEDLTREMEAIAQANSAIRTALNEVLNAMRSAE
ncbi:MAG: tetratricopeptide repeat protein, partial [Chloroflexota bacterium]